jgi:hypothetical protein
MDHVSCICEIKNKYRISVCKSEKKRCRGGLEVNNTIDFNELGYGIFVA